MSLKRFCDKCDQEIKPGEWYFIIHAEIMDDDHSYRHQVNIDVEIHTAEFRTENYIRPVNVEQEIRIIRKVQPHI